MYKVLEEDYVIKDKQLLGIVKEVRLNQAKFERDYETNIYDKQKDFTNCKLKLENVKNNNELIEKTLKKLAKKSIIIKKEIESIKERNDISIYENSLLKKHFFANNFYLQKLYCICENEDLEEIISRYKSIRTILEGNLSHKLFLEKELLGEFKELDSLNKELDLIKEKIKAKESWENKIQFDKAEKLERDNNNLYNLHISLIFKLTKLINYYFNKLGVIYFNKSQYNYKPFSFKQSNCVKNTFPSKSKSENLISKLLSGKTFEPKKDICIEKLINDLIKSKEKLRVKLVFKRLLKFSQFVLYLSNLNCLDIMKQNIIYRKEFLIVCSPKESEDYIIQPSNRNLENKLKENIYKKSSNDKKETFSFFNKENKAAKSEDAHLNDNSYISYKDEDYLHPPKALKDLATENKKDIYQRVCDLHKIKTELKRTLLPSEYRDYSETIFQFKKKNKKLECDKVKKNIKQKIPALKGSLDSYLNNECLEFVSNHSRNKSNKILPLQKEFGKTEIKLPINYLKVNEDQQKTECKIITRKTTSNPRSYNDAFLKDLFSNEFLNENINYIKQLKNPETMSQISNNTKSTKVISDRHGNSFKVISGINSGQKRNSFKISNFNIDN